MSAGLQINCLLLSAWKYLQSFAKYYQEYAGDGRTDGRTDGNGHFMMRSSRIRLQKHAERIKKNRLTKLETFCGPAAAREKQVVPERL
jgi:hypothetical protein